MTAPLLYLQSLGVEVATQVKLVVATHAHDDHIAGISEILEACESAFFVYPTAMSREEFVALVEIDAEVTKDLRKRNFAEYRRIQEIIGARDLGALYPARFGHEGRELYSRTGGSTTASVRSLSPSDMALVETLKKLRSYMPLPESALRPPDVDPNELAIALWVEVGGRAALLGSDLLVGPAGCGWEAVLASFLPSNKAVVYKVPHHGSSTADHPSVWSQLLEPDPVAALAPYRARYTVPNDSEIAVLSGRTANLFSAADPKAPAAPKNVKRAAATLSQIATNVRDPWGTVGHVRVRVESDGTWNVETFGPATALP